MCAAIARAQESCYSGPDGSNEIKDEMLTPLTDEERSFVALKPAPRVVVKPPPATSEIIGDESTAPAHDTAAIEAMFQRMEYYNMLETLQSTDWDQEEAARRLGVSRQTLELMMKMRGIKEPEGKPEG